MPGHVLLVFRSLNALDGDLALRRAPLDRLLSSQSSLYAPKDTSRCLFRRDSLQLDAVSDSTVDAGLQVLDEAVAPPVGRREDVF